jgi:hypothetical protein
MSESQEYGDGHNIQLFIIQTLQEQPDATFIDLQDR